MSITSYLVVINYLVRTPKSLLKGDGYVRIRGVSGSVLRRTSSATDGVSAGANGRYARISIHGE